MLHALLDATRAHAGFALRPGGEQALANVLRVAELARQYERGGGISFRGFVEQLRADAERGEAAEAPIVEEGTEGVRIMTVHRAKGLEFPVVILADMTCKRRAPRPAAGSTAGTRSARCARRLGAADLLAHDAEEVARDRAEGVRLAYVAATRARDLLVVPAVGDEVVRRRLARSADAGDPSAVADRRKPAVAAGCPVFPSKDTVLSRPDGDPARTTTVAPGAYVFEGTVRTPAMSEPTGGETTPFDSALPRSGRHSTLAGASNGGSRDKYRVVWWDPRVLALDAGTPFGLRRDDLIAKDGDAAGSTGRLAAYRQWEAQRTAAIADASRPSISSRTVTQMAANRELPLTDADALQIEVVELPRVASRPFGPRSARSCTRRSRRCHSTRMNGRFGRLRPLKGESCWGRDPE